jgi:hypothetical protein
MNVLQQVKPEEDSPAVLDIVHDPRGDMVIKVGAVLPHARSVYTRLS